MGFRNDSRVLVARESPESVNFQVLPSLPSSAIIHLTSSIEREVRFKFSTTYFFAVDGFLSLAGAVTAARSRARAALLTGWTGVFIVAEIEVVDAIGFNFWASAVVE